MPFHERVRTLLKDAGEQAEEEEEGETHTTNNVSTSPSLLFSPAEGGREGENQFQTKSDILNSLANLRSILQTTKFASNFSRNLEEILGMLFSALLSNFLIPKQFVHSC